MDDTIYILLIYLLIAIGINLTMFIPAYIFRTDRLTDLSYSATFIILAIIALIMNQITSATIIISAMIIIWGLRLGIFLSIRINQMGKDRRFDDIRDDLWKFLRFWILQGFAAWIIMLPALLFIATGGNRLFIIGALIWAIGLIIETVADYQKFMFRKRAENRGRFISEGLWKYSRHPNYFGEILCWVGIYVSVTVSLSLVQNFLMIIGPAFIIILLAYVTGVPILEKAAEEKWGKDIDYIKYKERTNAIIPKLWRAR